MKVYRGYKTKVDWEFQKPMVWMKTSIHDSAYLNDRGVILEYDLDETLLKPVPHDILFDLDQHESVKFPNDAIIKMYKERDYNCYFLTWEGYAYQEPAICILDKSLLTHPKMVTVNGIFVRYHYLCRKVNRQGENMLFAPMSLLEKWTTKGRKFPLDLDGVFNAFVEDRVFFNTDERDFLNFITNNRDAVRWCR